MTAAFGKRGMRTIVTIQSNTAQSNTPQTYPPQTNTAQGKPISVSPSPEASSAAPATPITIRSRLGALLFGLLFLFVGVYTLYSEGGSLVRDISHGNSYFADESLQVKKAECKRHWFVYSSCTIDLAWSDVTGARKDSVHFAVLFTSLGGERVVPLRSRRDPDAVSVQGALDRMLNRSIALVVMTLLSASLAFAAGLTAFRRG